MKVGFLHWPANWQSGHESFQATLLEGLLGQTRHEVTVFLHTTASAIDVPFPHRVLRFAPRPGRLSLLQARDRATERAEEAVIATSGVEALIAWAHFPKLDVDGIPYLALLHETDFLESVPWHWFPPRDQQRMAEVTVRSLAQASAIFANSRYTADRAAREFHIAADRAFVTPPAVRPFGHADTRLPEFPPYVAQVGWFHPRKNLALALDAWVAAREQGLPHHLVLIGRDGPYDFVRGTVARQIIDHAGPYAADVHVVGMVNRADYGRLLESAAALVVPSYQEGFCVPVIEAFSVGTPVVAAARSALVEVAGPVGTLVEPDAASMAAGLLDAVAHPPDADRLRSYASQFTTANCVRELLGALDAVATNEWGTRTVAERAQ